VKKRSETKTTMGGASAWTKQDKTSGEFMALKKAKNAGAIESCTEKGRRREKKTVKKVQGSSTREGILITPSTIKSLERVALIRRRSA
jgi:hypothetical protein